MLKNKVNWPVFVDNNSHLSWGKLTDKYITINANSKTVVIDYEILKLVLGF